MEIGIAKVAKQWTACYCLIVFTKLMLKVHSNAIVLNGRVFRAWLGPEDSSLANTCRSPYGGSTVIPTLRRLRQKNLCEIQGRATASRSMETRVNSVSQEEKIQPLLPPFSAARGDNMNGLHQVIGISDDLRFFILQKWKNKLPCSEVT